MEGLFNIKTVLLIRWKQTYRTLLQSGLIRLVILLILFLFLIAAVYTATEKTKNAAFISGVWVLLVSVIHVKRKDRIFLQINMNFDKLIYSVEYAALSIPLILCLLFNRQWLPAICLVLCISGIGFVDIRRRQQRKTLNTRLQQLIPSGMYEWKAGVRQYFFAIIIAWLFGLCASFFVPVVPVALFIIGVLIFDFYKTNESWQILLSCRKSAGKLLYFKIKQHVVFFGLLVAPLVIAFMIFHSEHWYIPVVEIVVLLSIHIYGIVLKYAFYSHDRGGCEVNPVLQITGMAIGLIPVTTPVLWLFSVYFFYKAKTNLYFYLNDYN